MYNNIHFANNSYVVERIRTAKRRIIMNNHMNESESRSKNAAEKARQRSNGATESTKDCGCSKGCGCGDGCGSEKE